MLPHSARRLRQGPKALQRGPRALAGALTCLPPVAEDPAMNPFSRRCFFGAGLAVGCSAPHAVTRPQAVATVVPPNISAPTVEAPVVPPPRADGRLPVTAVPLRYSLDLTIDPRRDRFAGVVNITLRVATPTRVVLLHGRGLAITHAEVLADGETLPAEVTSRSTVGAHEGPEELVVVVPRALQPGEATLRIAYTAAFDVGLRGVYHTQENGDWYAFSDFEPTDARRAFPCFDEPVYKVPVTLSVTVPSASIAVGNTPEISRTPNPTAGVTVFRFAPTEPLPSYLVAFAVGPFDLSQGPMGTAVPLRVVTARGRGGLTRTALDAAAMDLPVLASYFNRAYPYPKLDLVAVPDFRNGGMENAGLITFRDGVLLVDPARSTAQARRSVAGVIAHELSHQWFGDLVTMSWWNDLWLNEGFATWMTTKVIESVSPHEGAELDAVRSRNSARHVDGLPTARAIRAPVTSTSAAIEGFDAMAYDKGAAVLTMLESWLGVDHFREGVRRYLTDHAWGTATAEDLLAALAATAPTEDAGRVADVANSFLDRAGVPEVRVEAVCEAHTPTRVNLIQRRYAPDPTSPPGDECTPWSIPVCLRYEAPGGARTTCTVMTECTATVTLPGVPQGMCPRWIHPNPGATGYYWYTLSPAGFRALVNTPGALDAAGQLDLQADAAAMFEDGSLPVETYLGLVSTLARGRDPHVLVAVARAPWEIEHTLVSDASRRDFQRWVQATLRPMATRLGWTARPHDDDLQRQLRQTVLTTLGFLTDDREIQRTAEHWAQRWLADPTSVDPDVAAVAVPVASRHAGAERWDALVRAAERATLPQDRGIALSALTAFDDPALDRRGLDLLLTPTLRVQDIRALFARTGHTPAVRGMEVAWLEDRADALREKLGDTYRPVLSPLAGVCDAGEITTVRTVLGPRMEQAQGSARAFRLMLELAGRCARTRDRSLAGATAYFHQVAAMRR